MQENKLYTLLTYAGALPFIACAVLPLLGYDALPNVGRYDLIAEVYGLAIASFVAGSHWGTYLYNRDVSPTNLFVTSNVVVLSCFFAFLLTGVAITVFTLILAFAYLLFVDYTLYKVKVTTEYYFTMRLRVTLLVVASLAVLLFQAASELA